MYLGIWARQNQAVNSGHFREMIAGQSIGSVYNIASLGNALACNNAVANTAAAAEAAAINANAMAYAPYAGYGYPSNMYQNAFANPLAYTPASPIPFEAELPIVTGIPGITYGLSLADLAASRGGGLRVMTSSPISPTGITVQSDNMAVEGPLSVTGQLPFLGVVSVEGPLAAMGAGAVAYGCGNGNVGMVSEGINEPMVANPATLANSAALANAAYANGYGNPALGLAPSLGCNGLPVY
ncbi:chorion class CB protein PC404-like [Zerene cesonia]|uniref:chorion class CB protein PC404-like n=1 Tax=Zerene cesonia TaxID=33412 RepID=UPI0018E4F364|nr:chorion class CB protein PC404-like [Zerene cesonia]